MADPIDDVWSAPTFEDEEKKEKLSYKELLRRSELQEKQNLQQDIELDAARRKSVDLQDKLTKLEAELRTEREGRVIAEQQGSKLAHHVSTLEKENASGGADRVIYKGKIHRIVRVNTAKWFALDDFRKRFVEEDDTVVVIDRKGI